MSRYFVRQIPHKSLGSNLKRHEHIHAKFVVVKEERVYQNPALTIKDLNIAGKVMGKWWAENFATIVKT
jgi:hypothetical protein